MTDRQLTRLERKMVLSQTDKALREIRAGDPDGALHTLSFLREWLYQQQEKEAARPLK